MSRQHVSIFHVSLEFGQYYTMKIQTASFRLCRWQICNFFCATGEFWIATIQESTATVYFRPEHKIYHCGVRLYTTLRAIDSNSK